MDLKWSPSMMLEVTLKTPEDFLKIKETLTRMGIASKDGKKLYQSAHILHKQGKYYILHFLELFAYDRKREYISNVDILRRNTIAYLLQQWGLLEIVGETPELLPTLSVRIVSYSEKEHWELIPKYSIGVRH